jgi:hypothetical protein
VWHVKRIKDAEHFAWKEIDLRKLVFESVMKEVDTMMKLLPHPNIVKLHEHWRSADGKDMWLLLEYCSAGTLTQFMLSSSRLEDAALLDLCGQLLCALYEFEKHRIVHNDIKLENIFILRGGVPKIGDLGMARFTSAGSVLTRTPGGTPWFQAPEVLSKERGADSKPLHFPQFVSCEISYQSDVFSLGVVMWSLIMRRYPDHPGAVSMMTPTLVADGRLREVINRMLQPDLSKRPRASQLITIPVPVPVPVPIPPSYAVMSPSEFEAAVGDQAAARHAYVDTLQAALPVCEAGEKRAVDSSDYDDAARFSIFEKGIRAILAGIEKPKSKAEIKAALDGGIISQIEQAERALHLEWQRNIDLEKAELGHRVNFVQQGVDLKTAQLLDQEKAAAAQKDFARAKQLKVAREASARVGVSAVDKITKELEERLSAIRVREPKPSETRGRGCNGKPLPSSATIQKLPSRI